MSRVQLALNVNDIDEAVAFYTALFGTGPAKRRPGYANFAVAEPPLKLVLLENPGQGGTLNHLGVEVADAETVDAEQARLAQAGLAAVDERDTTCCYARQDKFWVTGAPGGERWEIYTVLADSPTFWGQDSEQRWNAVEAELDNAPAGQATQCCGDPQAGSATGDAATGVCCA
jgi:catechol 2,3-dioxygenase-like lactoylglutathione lyase family enzyme